MDLTNYFQRRVSSFGYSDDHEIGYSLSYCQGDGMAFYGNLDAQSLDALIDRFAPAVEPGAPLPQTLRMRRKRELLKAFVAVYKEWDTVDIEILHNAPGRYHHWNSMEISTGAMPSDEMIEVLESEDCNHDDDEDSSAIAEPSSSIAAVKHGAPLWEAFIDWLDKDVQSISKTLEKEGYNIQECTSSEPRTVWERETPNFRVTVELEGDFDGMSHWDEDFAHDTLLEFAQGKGCMYSLCAWVTCLPTGDILARASIGGISTNEASLDDTNGRDAGHLADLVYDVLALAKERLQTYQSLAA